MPNILIIIVTWNKKSYILELLASLAKPDYPSQAIDILVIDNASTDGTVGAIKAAYPYIHLICNPDNLGGTGGFIRKAFGYCRSGFNHDAIRLSMANK